MIEKYSVGQIIECNVTGIEKYGIFVVSDEKISGLIHISEISDNFVKEVSDYAELGEVIYAKIIEIDLANKFLKLTIKNMNYRNIDNKGIGESISSFSTLADELPGWIDTKLKEIDSRDI